MSKEKTEKRTQKKVINKDKQTTSKPQKASAPSGFYYSFLTIILLLCLIQISISAVYNISKIISYKAKIIQMTNAIEATQALNDQLQYNINNFSNEAIARNSLKMSGKDEVLVIINTAPENNIKEEKETVNKLIKIKKHD